MFRSDTVDCYKLTIHRENAYEILNHLGYLDIMQIECQNKETILPTKMFNKSINRCNILLEKIERLSEVCRDNGFDIVQCDKVKNLFQHFKDFLMENDDQYKQKALPESTRTMVKINERDVIEDIENQVREKEEFLNQQFNNNQAQIKKILELQNSLEILYAQVETLKEDYGQIGNNNVAKEEPKENTESFFSRMCKCLKKEQP